MSEQSILEKDLGRKWMYQLLFGGVFLFFLANSVQTFLIFLIGLLLIGAALIGFVLHWPKKQMYGLFIAGAFLLPFYLMEFSDLESAMVLLLLISFCIIGTALLALIIDGLNRLAK